MDKNDGDIGAQLQKAHALVTRNCKRSDVSPLRYPGGKRKLAPLVADLVVKSGLEVDLFVEPFAGGAAVSISLLESGLVRNIALGDIDPLVASFWQVVFSDDAQDLVRMVGDVPVTLAEWEKQKALTPGNRLEAAFKCLFLNRTSFSGALMSDTGPIGGRSQKSAYKIDCRFNRERICARILELSELRRRVRFVRCASYREIAGQIRQMTLAKEHPEAILWYLDPPFFAKADRLYRFSFRANQHDLLYRDIGKGHLPGHWILSYDDHERARELYDSHEGYARVNLRYSARVDVRERLVSSEIIVSDLIASLRETGRMPGGAEIIDLASRRLRPGQEQPGDTATQQHARAG